MKTRKLIIALGLGALLLVTSSIVGCGLIGNQPSNPSEPGQAPPTPESQQPANPLEEMEKSSKDGETHYWTKSDMPPEYPEGPSVASGIVRKVTSNTLDLEIATGDSAVIYGSEYESGTQTKMIQIVFNPSTKVYRWLHQVAKLELQELTLADLSEGPSIDVWGEEMSGDRVFADTIIIH